MQLEDIRDEIYYIEDINGNACVHGKNDTYELAIPFIDIKERLTSNYYYANPNVIINADKVVEYDYIECQIVFDNGVHLDKLLKKYNIC